MKKKNRLLRKAHTQAAAKARGAVASASQQASNGGHAGRGSTKPRRMIKDIRKDRKPKPILVNGKRPMTLSVNPNFRQKATAAVDVDDPMGQHASDGDNSVSNDERKIEDPLLLLAMDIESQPGDNGTIDAEDDDSEVIADSMRANRGLTTLSPSPSPSLKRLRATGSPVHEVANGPQHSKKSERHKALLKFNEAMRRENEDIDVAFFEWLLARISCEEVHELWKAYERDWKRSKIPDFQLPPSTHRPINLYNQLKKVRRDKGYYRAQVREGRRLAHIQPHVLNGRSIFAHLLDKFARGLNVASLGTQAFMSQNLAATIAMVANMGAVPEAAGVAAELAVDGAAAGDSTAAAS